MHGLVSWRSTHFGQTDPKLIVHTALNVDRKPSFVHVSGRPKGLAGSVSLELRIATASLLTNR